MKRISSVLSLVIKLLIIVALVAIGLIVYQTCSGAPLVQRIDRMMPDESVAPYKVVTQTRVYVASRAENNADGTVTMVTWYNRDRKGKGVKHTESITLPAVLRPVISRR